MMKLVGVTFINLSDVRYVYILKESGRCYIALRYKGRLQISRRNYLYIKRKIKASKYKRTEGKFWIQYSLLFKQWGDL